MEKKNLKIMSLGIVGALIFTIGTSYALWIYQSRQENKNVIVSDCFEVNFKEETSAVNLQNVYPLTDEMGMKESSYQFSITNKCNSNVRYQVLLESGENSTLDEKYLKVSLDKRDAKILSSLPNENRKFLMKEAYLGGNETKTYEVNLWMGSHVTINDTDAMNKTFQGKVKIEAYYTKDLKREIIYELFGGTFKEGYEVPKEHTYGKVLSLPTSSNIIKEDYVFEGWYDNPEFTGTIYDQIDIYHEEDIILYAKFRRPKILYDGAGATYNYNEIHYSTWEGKNITLSNEVILNPYTFEGWYLDNTYTKKVTEITKEHFQEGKDLNLYAKWNVVTDFWYYETNTSDKVENMPDSHIFIQGVETTIAPEIPIRDGYTFVGWNRRQSTMDIWNDLVYPGDKISTNSATLAERKLYAVWKKKGDFEIDGVQYHLINNTTVSAVGRTSTTSTLNIPSAVTYHNVNYKVTTIDQYAFANDQNIENLIISEGIEKIEEGIFYFDWNIKSLTLANTIKSIGAGAFRFVAQITELTLPEELTLFKTGAFKSCLSLTTINFNNKLLTIEDVAFGYTGIKAIVLPDSVETMGMQYITFNSFHIGNNLSNLEINFQQNASLTISKENKNFKMQDNYLLSMDGKRVYGYIGSWNNIKIPNGVEDINRHSFAEVSSANPIVLPDGLKNIEYRGFYNTQSPEINIPASVESISVSGFVASKIKTIKVHKVNGTLSGAPWGTTVSDIQWLG